MTRRVLIIISTVLFFFLAGLTALYLYVNRGSGKPSTLLDFVPGEISFIIRVRETSSSLLPFFDHPVVKDIQPLEEAGHYWHMIDSITSRNYKTSDILRSQTSYICLDSAMRYMILLDLPEKVHEYFIDQFLVNTGKASTIKKFEKGLKAFYPEPGKPLYYFIKENVFGISPDKELLIQSLDQYHVPQPLDQVLAGWDAGTSASITVWGKKYSEKNILSKFLPAQAGFDGWLDNLSLYYWFDVELKNDMLRLRGSLMEDTLNGLSALLSAEAPGSGLHMMLKDSLPDVNKRYSFQVEDSVQQKRPVVFSYHQYPDSAGHINELVVVDGDMAGYLYRLSLQDTSSQLITMADPLIPRINVTSPEVMQKISPYPLLMFASEKIFFASIGTSLVIGSNTEVILNEGLYYEKKFDHSVDIETATLVAFYDHIRWSPGGQIYVHDLRIKWGKKHVFSFQLGLSAQ